MKILFKKLYIKITKNLYVPKAVLDIMQEKDFKILEPAQESICPEKSAPKTETKELEVKKAYLIVSEDQGQKQVEAVKLLTESGKEVVIKRGGSIFLAAQFT